MAQKMICDYCLREITANYTRMTVQTLNTDRSTAEAAGDEFEFHPRCYNALQGLISQMQQQQEPPPLDPSSPPPVQQPVNDDDPEVVIPVDFTTPVTDPVPEPAAPVDDTPPARRPTV
jgi:hypothetical protein